MKRVGRVLDQLRDFATAEPNAFARCLESLLATDFDKSFHFLKTQKLLFRRRSAKWISDLERELQPWLGRASLKGKQRSQLRRYLLISKSIQQLLQIIDEQSSGLRIWQASTEDLLQALFGSVEELHFKQSMAERKESFSNELSVLKHMEILGSEHRYGYHR